MKHYSPAEEQAREVLGQIGFDTPGIDEAQMAVKLVFLAMYYTTLPVERITRIAEALYNGSFTQHEIQSALYKMARAKVLRSRLISGERHYEVNF